MAGETEEKVEMKELNDADSNTAEPQADEGDEDSKLDSPQDVRPKVFAKSSSNHLCDAESVQEDDADHSKHHVGMPSWFSSDNNCNSIVSLSPYLRRSHSTLSQSLSSVNSSLDELPLGASANDFSKLLVRDTRCSKPCNIPTNPFPDTKGPDQWPKRPPSDSDSNYSDLPVSSKTSNCQSTDSRRQRVRLFERGSSKINPAAALVKQISLPRCPPNSNMLSIDGSPATTPPSSCDLFNDEYQLETDRNSKTLSAIAQLAPNDLPFVEVDSTGSTESDIAQSHSAQNQPPDQPSPADISHKQEMKDLIPRDRLDKVIYAGEESTEKELSESDISSINIKTATAFIYNQPQQTTELESQHCLVTEIIQTECAPLRVLVADDYICELSDTELKTHQKLSPLLDSRAKSPTREQSWSSNEKSVSHPSNCRRAQCVRQHSLPSSFPTKQRPYARRCPRRLRQYSLPSEDPNLILTAAVPSRSTKRNRHTSDVTYDRDFSTGHYSSLLADFDPMKSSQLSKEDYSLKERETVRPPTSIDPYCSHACASVATASSVFSTSKSVSNISSKVGSKSMSSTHSGREPANPHGLKTYSLKPYPEAAAYIADWLYVAPGAPSCPPPAPPSPAMARSYAADSAIGSAWIHPTVSVSQRSSLSDSGIDDDMLLIPHVPLPPIAQQPSQQPPTVSPSTQRKVAILIVLLCVINPILGVIAIQCFMKTRREAVAKLAKHKNLQFFAILLGLGILLTSMALLFKAVVYENEAPLHPVTTFQPSPTRPQVTGPDHSALVTSFQGKVFDNGPVYDENGTLPSYKALKNDKPRKKNNPF